MKTNRYQMILKPVMVLLIDVLFSVLVIIGFASSMNAIVPFILAALLPAIYNTVVSYDLKKEGLPVWNYIIVFIIIEVTLLTLMVNHTFAANIFRLFTGHFNLEATVFYLLYAVLPCTGGLVGLGLGWGIWKKKNMLY